jgi:hypothetical protein
MQPCRKSELWKTTTTIKTRNARNGKIARLPRDVREELKERLKRSGESPQLLD